MGPAPGAHLSRAGRSAPGGCLSSAAASAPPPPPGPAAAAATAPWPGPPRRAAPRRCCLRRGAPAAAAAAYKRSLLHSRARGAAGGRRGAVLAALATPAPLGATPPRALGAAVCTAVPPTPPQERGKFAEVYGGGRFLAEDRPQAAPSAALLPLHETAPCFTSSLFWGDRAPVVNTHGQS